MIQIISIILVSAGIILVDIATGNTLLAAAIFLVVAGYEFHIRDVIIKS